MKPKNTVDGLVLEGIDWLVTIQKYHNGGALGSALAIAEEMQDTLDDLISLLNGETEEEG
jgi:hypothetical protein